MGVQEALAAAATRLALDVGADAILILTETGRTCEAVIQNGFSELVAGQNQKQVKLVAATTKAETYEALRSNFDVRALRMLVHYPSRVGQVRHAVWLGLREGIFSPGERVVCLVGDAGVAGGTNAILVHHVEEQELKAAELVETDPIVGAAVELAMELGKEGRVGTAFIVGDSEEVLRRSRQLALNPFAGSNVLVTNPSDRGLLKRFAYLDGAFVIDDGGRVMAAGRYLDADVSRLEIPRGLGTRHRAVAAMTAATMAKGVTVSGEDAMVRVFERGRLVVRIDPHDRMLLEVFEERMQEARASPERAQVPERASV